MKTMAVTEVIRRVAWQRSAASVSATDRPQSSAFTMIIVAALEECRQPAAWRGFSRRAARSRDSCSCRWKSMSSGAADRSVRVIHAHM